MKKQVTWNTFLFTILCICLLGTMLPFAADGVLVQSGLKFFGNDAGGDARQGSAVALSEDGKTALVAGPQNNYDTSGTIGATWVFVRNSDSGVWSQQAKLVGSGAAIHYGQAVSVALSGDGNLALVGDYDEGFWAFAREDGQWSQKGSRYLGTGSVVTGAIKHGGQGGAIAISSDGTTAVVGGSFDNSVLGAVWIFVRDSSTGLWSQQGSKLVGADYVRKIKDSGGGFVAQGESVAISGDGNTVLVGGSSDNYFVGAAWVFIRNQTSKTWSQQGSKLIGTFNSTLYESPFQGYSVALSKDGDTAAIAGFNAGYVWIFLRKDGIWTELQSFSRPTDGGAYAGLNFGLKVALSGDGNVALVTEGSYSSSFQGGVWTFVRNISMNGGNDTWEKQGNMLQASDSGDLSYFGISTSLSYEGSTALIGAPLASGSGAAWIFVELTLAPTYSPTTSQPSTTPSTTPSWSPTQSPTTARPSRVPSSNPTLSPSTSRPSVSPSTSRPSLSPSTSNPTSSPSSTPSLSPSNSNAATATSFLSRSNLIWIGMICLLTLLILS